MTSTSKKILALPAAFFIDTNVLEALPETLESGELNSLVSEANQVHSKVYLPDVVAREWISHRLNRIINSYVDIVKGLRYLKKYINSVSDFELKNNDEISDAIWKNCIRRIKNTKLRILRPPIINTRSMTYKAVYNFAPFTDTNKGFKDELIILSMLDIARRWTFKSSVLVTNDGHFVEEEIRHQFEDLEIEFRVVKNLNEATKLIIDASDETAQRHYQQILESAFEYVKIYWKEISSNIIEKVKSDGVSEFILKFGNKYSALDGTLKRIISVKPIEVKEVRLKTPDETETDFILITISVDVELELEYERMDFSLTELFGRKIKTTEEKEEYKPARYVRYVKTEIVSASVEAKTKFANDNWEGFEISGVMI